MERAYDVIVVGARVAGSTLAALVGEAGHSVLVLDRAAFPSTTCSTHFFRGAGMVSVLERLGCLEAVLALGCPPLTHELNYVNDARVSDDPPQDPGAAGYCLSVRREPLDSILVGRASGVDSVELALRTAVSDVVWDDGRAVGVELNDGRVVRARLVIGADGRHSILARRVSAVTEHESPAYRALYYRYLAGFSSPTGQPPDAAEFSLVDDELAYIFPSDSGLTCVALSVNLETFRWLRQEPARRFDRLVARHLGFAERVRSSEPVGGLLGSGPERNYVRVPYGPGWALVGDAALHQDPWTGMGIDMAGVHATFLAEAVIDSLRGTTREIEAFAAYHKRRNEHGLAAYHETVEFAADLRALTAAG